MRLPFRFLAALVVSVVPLTASAQGVTPSGTFTPGHALQALVPGGSVYGDAGTSAGSPFTPGTVGGNLSSLGVTGSGIPFCVTDAITTGPYYQLCLGANALGTGLISFNSYGGATPTALNFNINGTNYAFPQTGAGSGNVTGPATTVVGHIPTFNNTVGTLLADPNNAFSTTGTGAAAPLRGNFSGYAQYLFSTTENMTGGAAGIIGLESDISNTGTTAANGLRIAIVGECKLNTTIAFVLNNQTSCQGIFGVGAGLASQGGTVGGGSAAGSIWGVAGIASLFSPATGYVSVTNEFDVRMPTGTSANLRYAVNAVDYQSAVQGNNEDAAYAVTASLGSVAFKNGLLFSSSGGGAPLSTSASVLTSLTSIPLAVTNGIDLNNFTTSGVAFRGPSGSFAVDGIGNITGKNLTLTTGFINGPTLVLETAGVTSVGIDANQLLQFSGATSFVANGAVATAMSAVGPAGSHTTVQGWFSFKDPAGVVRYVPAF